MVQPTLSPQLKLLMLNSSHSISTSIWPETLVFWGAGATAALGMPSTAAIGKIVKDLTSKKSCSSIVEYLQTTCFKPIAEELALFLEIVGVSLGESYLVPDKASGVLAKMLPNSNDVSRRKVANRWRQVYDWESLKAVANTINVENDGAAFLTQLYNVLDGSIVQQSGISAEIKGRQTLLHGECVRRARMLLDYFTIASLSSGYLNTLDGTPSQIERYVEFVEMLAKLMEDEGIRLSEYFAVSGLQASEEKFYASRAFYLFSYAIVSMNYEPVFLWLLWNAHRNRNANPSCIGSRNRMLKLLNDHSLFFGIRKIEDELGESDDSVWYPCNEPVVQRMNRHNYDHYVNRVGKFFYPHGNVNFRECPNCGKLNISFGDAWGYRSKTLFVHNPFPDKFTQDYSPKDPEKGQFNQGLQDVQQCVFCGNLLHTENVSMVPQSAFKGRHAPFIEEIQRDMKMNVEKAKHIVLLGYSLPSDDVIWRSVMAAKKEGTKYCSVVCGFKGEHKWMYGDELDAYCKRYEKDDHKEDFGYSAIKNAIDVFGKNNVRAYTGGIPQVWENGIGAVRDLLYPNRFFDKDILEERVKKFTGTR